MHNGEKVSKGMTQEGREERPFLEHTWLEQDTHLLSA